MPAFPDSATLKYSETNCCAFLFVPMNTEIKKEIERVREIKRLALNEDTTQTAIVLPLLGKLGWSISDPSEVYLEYKVGNLGWADIALIVQGKPVVFIETKAARNNRLEEKDREQLLKYCKGLRIQLGVLTNGLDWYLYSKAASPKTKIDHAVRINLAEDQLDEVADDLGRFLSKNRMDGETAHEAIESKKIDRALVEKWRELLREGSSDLASALRRKMKAEDIPVSFAMAQNFIQQCSDMPENERTDAVLKETKRTSRPKAQVVQSNKEMRPRMMALLDLLRRNPTATQVQIAEALGISDSGAYSALKRAKKQGYIHMEKHGRTCTYQVLVAADSRIPLETKGRVKAAPVPVKAPRAK